MQQQRLECCMCYFSTNTPANLTYHVVRNHRFDPRFFVKCNVNGCGATYTKWNSYKMHVKRCHRENDDMNVLHADREDFGDPMGAELQLDPDAEILEDEPPEMNGLQLLQWHAGKLLLYVRDKCGTSNRAMLMVMEGVKQLLKQYNTILRGEIEESSHPVTHTVNMDSIREIFEERLPESLMFSSVETKSKVGKFLVSELGMIVPLEIEMGRQLVWMHKPRVHVVEKVFKGYMIPLLDSLRRLLTNQQVRYCIENPKPTRTVMKSILDGKYYRSHPFFSSNPNALGIILYYDEMEICNPTGSRTHQLGMFYWTLANIHPEYRSTFRAINLLAVVRYCHIKKFGVDKILNSFVEDINTLQNNGVTITVNGLEKNYKGSLLIVTGDTPASALLGGFKRSVSKTVRPCRRCMTTQDQLKMYFKELHFEFRELEKHLDHVAAVTEPNITQLVRNFWSRAYGVNDRSPLLNIHGFDVTKCLVQDIMHILSEGVLKVACSAFIAWCVRMNFFSLDTLNERIDQFDYGHLSKDKPSPITSDHLDNNLRQSASQMVCLSHTLPFLISDLLKGEDGIVDNAAYERLLCHVRILQIVNICFAYEISEQEARFLGHLIEVCLLKYSNLYPETLVPKFHFLVHIVDQIIEFGPARQHFCMRFEAAHSWFKSLIRVLRNFKNMPSTLAYRFEAMRCLELAHVPDGQSKSFLYSGHHIKYGEMRRVADLDISELLSQQLPVTDEPNGISVMVSPEIIVFGTVFRPNSIILVECEDEELPVFAKIGGIYVYEGSQILFSFQNLQTVSYFEELNAYLLDTTNLGDMKVINVKDLTYLHPLSLFTFNRSKFVVLFNHTRSEYVN